MRGSKSSQQATFPCDPCEVRRFKSIYWLSRELFETIRPDLHIWRFGDIEYISEQEGIAAIGRRADVRSPLAFRRKSRAPISGEAAR
jgi:hypothetical protein